MENQNKTEMNKINTNTRSTEVILESKKGYSWRHAIGLITWGFLITSFTLNFLLLQYILPTIGTVLLYLGFRELRKCNTWFYVTWILSGIKLIWQLLLLIISATPLNVLGDNNIVLGMIGIILQLALFITFRTATGRVFHKANRKPVRDPILGLICWTTIVAICALILPAGYGLIVVIPVIIFYLAMIRSLFRMGNDLDDVPDSFIEAPIKVGNRVIAGGYLIICILCIMISCVFANHIALDETQQVEAKENDIHSELVDLGFPEDIITDISDDDIALLSDAHHVEYYRTSMSFRYQELSDQSSNENQDTSSPKGMQLTTVYTVLPENYLYIIVHFDWKDNDNKVYWQDGFTIEREESVELLNGVLLYNKNGVNYTAPIPRLKSDNVTINNMFGSSQSRQISGAVSYPFTSENQRGYIFYRVQLPAEPDTTSNILKCIHNKHPFLFPYEQAEDSLNNGIFNEHMELQFTNFDYKGEWGYDRQEGE